MRLAEPDEILDRLPVLGQQADYVVADGPGSNTETSRAVLLRADLALVPCKASMLEVRALAQATNVLRQAQDIRGGQPKALIVLSMVGKTYRLTQDMKDAAAALELPLAKTALTLRQIYADAPGQGAVVWHLGLARPRGARTRCCRCAGSCCRAPGPSCPAGPWPNTQAGRRRGEGWPNADR